MLTPPDDAAKVVRIIRTGYRSSFAPSIVCFLSAAGFAAFHHLLYAAGFLFSGVVYLPIALSQYRHNKRASEKAIRDYLQYANDQKA